MMENLQESSDTFMAQRFRGFLPVVVDVETGGFDSHRNALLEVAAVLLEMDGQGNLQIKESYSKNIEPFPGAIVEESALEFTGIDIYPFSCFDTSGLAGLAYGQTVLAKACKAASIDFNNNDAHSALYDTVKTAELFCGIVNRWKELGGWPLKP